jgi:hypothetical protein
MIIEHGNSRDKMLSGHFNADVASVDYDVVGFHSRHEASISMSKIAEVLQRLAVLEAEVAEIGHNGGPPLDDEQPPKRKAGMTRSGGREGTSCTCARWSGGTRTASSNSQADLHPWSSLSRHRERDAGTAPARATAPTRGLRTSPRIGTSRRLCPAETRTLQQACCCADSEV